MCCKQFCEKRVFSNASRIRPGLANLEEDGTGYRWFPAPRNPSI
jgi:hypothetical protein